MRASGILPASSVAIPAGTDRVVTSITPAADNVVRMVAGPGPLCATLPQQVFRCLATFSQAGSGHSGNLLSSDEIMSRYITQCLRTDPACVASVASEFLHKAVVERNLSAHAKPSGSWILDVCSSNKVMQEVNCPSQQPHE